MGASLKIIPAVAFLSVSSALFSFNHVERQKAGFSFPYKPAGLTERQAAAHLLSRFTYGAKPGEVDEVIKTGLETWFQQQLSADLKDDDLTQRLSGYDALNLTNQQVVAAYPKGAQVLRMAVRDGVLDKSEIDKTDKEAYKSKLRPYMLQKGFKPQKELFRQFINQKILRAAYTNNQLQELMTDFWFNHFNVSITKANCAEFIPAYERDVIRPNVFGKFSDLLLATAKSPAMLLYLDNFSSAGTNTDMQMQGNGRMRRLMEERMENTNDSASKQLMTKLQERKKAKGLNENYAREVMELHTLGVDGGYTQQDVTQAARVLTGWTIYPMGEYGQLNAMKKVMDRVGEGKAGQRGFVHEGDFLFAANRHDNGEKMVLGKTFKDNGYQEGADLLNMLAHHPSTAKFIARKIAVRFVNDNPPQSLVDKMAKTFTDKDGDIKQVLITMVSAPEFWSKYAVREKTKSPFELAISAVRSLRADIAMPYQLYNWIDKMGQKMYYYQAPTGFPDKGQYWINTGALLNRMNFGLALASQRIPGIKIDLLALNHGHEPESAEAALATYSKIVMPDRDLTATIKRLTPLLHDPELEKKVDQAAGKSPVEKQVNMVNEDADLMADSPQAATASQSLAKDKGSVWSKSNAVQVTAGNNSRMSQVVGIILGSPEFQRK